MSAYAMGRTNTGELIGPYDTVEELERELADANAEAALLEKGYRYGLRDLNDSCIPFYVRTHNRIRGYPFSYVVIGGGCYQLLTADGAAEFVRNSQYLADDES